MRPELQDCVSRLRSCEALESAVELLKRSTELLGLHRNAVVADYSSNDLVCASRHLTLAEMFGWSRAQVEDWVNGRMTVISPVGAACRFARRPFVCRLADVSLPVPLDLQPSQERIFDFLGAAGVVGFIVTPVHQPLGRIGAVIWMSQDPDQNLNAILDENEDALFLLGQYFIDVVVRSAEPRRGPEGAFCLSERERECLTWVALGKTEKEVGIILGRAPTTIRFHVDNAVRKLCATNRAQAVAKAAQLGIIGAVV